MEMEMDRLSALPDDLLIHILSGLSLEEAANTCLLSKRWRFVLTDLPSLLFTETTGEIEAVNRFKACVHGALASRRGAALESLFLYFFSYDESMASDVDSWVESAAKNKVQDLDLSIINYMGQHFTLHHTMYSNSWLKRLTLRSCSMAANAAVEWRSMTEISLRNCVVPQQAIDNIVSGCPALRSLQLNACHGFNRLEIGGAGFRSLNVAVAFYQHELLEISAPYMLDFAYAGDPATATLRLTNAVSLQKVELHLCLNEFEFDDQDYSVSASLITNACHIFRAIRCANILVLRYHTLKVLSMMANNGWQLPQFKVEEMTISFKGDVRNTDAAMLILQSSPFLHTLSIASEYAEESVELDPTTLHNLNCDLLYLKIVRIFVSAFSSKSSFTLAQTLLKRAPILEEMVICKSKLFHPSKDLVENFETLFSYPKSSYKARIVICRSHYYHY